MAQSCVVSATAGACLPGLGARPTYRGRVTMTTGTAGEPRLAVDAPHTEAPTASTQPPAAEAPFVVTAPPPPLPGLLARARADGLTGPAVVALSVLLVALGAAADLRGDPAPGLGTAAALLLAAAGAPAVVRFRSLATAAVLPPLLLTGAAAGLAWAGGRTRGLRELVLDVGTVLALSAPLLFAATALGLVVVLARVARRLRTR